MADYAPKQKCPTTQSTTQQSSTVAPERVQQQRGNAAAIEACQPQSSQGDSLLDAAAAEVDASQDVGVAGSEYSGGMDQDAAQEGYFGDGSVDWDVQVSSGSYALSDAINSALEGWTDASPDASFSVELDMKVWATPDMDGMVQGSVELDAAIAIQFSMTDNMWWRADVGAGLSLTGQGGVEAGLKSAKLMGAESSLTGAVSVGLSGTAPTLVGAASSAVTSLPELMAHMMTGSLRHSNGLFRSVRWAVLSAVSLPKNAVLLADSSHDDTEAGFSQGPVSEVGITGEVSLAAEVEKGMALSAITGPTGVDVPYGLDTRRERAGEAGASMTKALQMTTMYSDDDFAGTHISQVKTQTMADISSHRSEVDGLEVGDLAHGTSKEGVTETMMREHVDGDLVLDNNGLYLHEFVSMDESLSLGLKNRFDASVGGQRLMRRTYTWSEAGKQWVLMYEREVAGGNASLGVGAMSASSGGRVSGRGGGSISSAGSAAGKMGAEHEGGQIGESLTAEHHRHVGETLGTQTLAYVRQRYMRGAIGGTYYDGDGMRQRHPEWENFWNGHISELQEMQDNMAEPQDRLSAAHDDWQKFFGGEDARLHKAARGSLEEWRTALEDVFEEELGIRQDIPLRDRLSDLKKLVEAGKIVEAHHLAATACGGKFEDIGALASWTNWPELAAVFTSDEHQRYTLALEGVEELRKLIYDESDWHMPWSDSVVNQEILLVLMETRSLGLMDYTRELYRLVVGEDMVSDLSGDLAGDDYAQAMNLVKG